MFDSIRELISYYNISFNDILITTDAGNIMALVFLDLISAFDFVDHGMLWSRLEHCIGIRALYVTVSIFSVQQKTFSLLWQVLLFCSECYMWCSPGIDLGTDIVFTVFVTHGIYI